ncbi:MAG: 5,10-methylenetetrahydrofolate reductase [Gammaproteobacteria bacterium BRH_c0]|nr:MAG: 5,10-methylenetetrahydrofolate reductase [Gammaproteobacteria bacterium BRH_c0]
MPTPKISFEFFPPKTPEGRVKLLAARDQLAALKPEYFSVTYGAGGSTRDNTRDIVMQIHRDGYAVAPHLSFGGDSEQAVLELIQSYKDAGIRHIVALRGDMPSGMGIHKLVNANELVALVRAHFGDHFQIKVAAYPEIHPDAESYQKDVYWLGEKFRAGADCAITQYFYNADAYFYFMEQCAQAGIDKPVIPGIMPITNFQNLVRFSDACGADIPRWLRQKMNGFGADSDGLKAFGEEVVSRLCEKLRAGGAPGFHFYTMNQAEPTLGILTNLGIQ